MFEACFYYLAAYPMMLLGYYCVIRSPTNIGFHLDTKSKLPDWLLDIVISTFMVIGVANFSLNVLVYAGGNVFKYMANVSLRYMEFEEQGTTLGYLFSYTAMYLWHFKIVRRGRLVTPGFLLFLLITGMMVASTGRVFSTLLHIASFFCIMYFVELQRRGKPPDSKYAGLLFGTAVLGIGLYFMRLLSSMAYNNMIKGGLLASVTPLLTAFGYFAIGKGNLPNVALFLKIIDAWKDDIGFLYGQSLITWVLNILPSALRPKGYQPSVMIYEAWYTHFVGGGHPPPTGIGEMYLNFGVLGPVLGMLAFGAGMGILYKVMLKSRSYLFLAIFSQIAIGFVMLYPKTEFDNMTLWYVLPIGATLSFCRIAAAAARREKVRHAGRGA
jgi:hypothetical protein